MLPSGLIQHARASPVGLGWRRACGIRGRARPALSAGLFVVGRARSGRRRPARRPPRPMGRARDCGPTRRSAIRPCRPTPTRRRAPGTRARATDNPIGVSRPERRRRAPTAAPGPGRGVAGGAPTDHAYRRDRTTLRARLADGAAEAQPARLRTSRRPASAQAIRREPVVGMGDAVRTRAPPRTPGAPAPRPARLLARGGGRRGGDDEAAPPAEPPRPAGDGVAAIGRRRGAGPLDAEAGPRSFDDERPGRAADDATSRAASDEPIRGGSTSPPRPRPRRRRRAPGAARGAPGAVAGRRRGGARLWGPDRAAAPRGAGENARRQLRPLQAGDPATRPQRARVSEGARAPARTGRDDRRVLGGHRRSARGTSGVKSSGFEEFDSAALRAVRRAAPFPAMTNQVARPGVDGRSFDNP